MSYCINPVCPAPDQNASTTNFCITCGSKILLKDRYRAEQLLGQGGFGKTFKAIDEDQPRKPFCAIKQFAFGTDNPKLKQTALALFYEEARHLEALGKHEQIPELLAYFDVESQPYLVQQFIDGLDLEREVAIEGTFNQQKILELLQSLLPVLDFLHSQAVPVIHRDLKPANIIRRRSDGGLVLVDFGAAKQASQTMLAKTGTMIGSPEYTAPEQARGKPLFASDIYSLGVTCIFLLTQVSPFDLFDVSQDAWVWRDYLVDNPVNDKLGQVLDQMIANSLPKRYQSAKAVLQDLNGSTNKPLPTAVSISPKLVLSPQTAVSYPQLESFSFETAKFVMVKKNVSKKISLKEGLIFQRWVEHEIIETVDVMELQRQKGQAQRFVENLGNGVKLEMVQIPAGEFTMGAPSSEKESRDSERPQHRVQVTSFYMGRFPVTQAQYQAVMGKNPSRFKGDDLPVEKVSWYEAQAFCEKLMTRSKWQYRLPSEAEWEYACRAGTMTPFYFGETISTNAANYNGNYIYGAGIKGEYRGMTTVVGSFPANSFGLHDMHGNIWEWCADGWHRNYEGAPTDSSARLNGGSKLLRGGCWYGGPRNCRSAVRNGYNPVYQDNNIGFRVVCVAARTS